MLTLVEQVPFRRADGAWTTLGTEARTTGCTIPTHVAALETLTESSYLGWDHTTQTVTTGDELALTNASNRAPSESAHRAGRIRPNPG